MAVKRIFYVTSNELSAVYIDGGQVNLLGRFQLTDDGVEEFSDFIQRDPDHPSAFIVDVIEEEFRIENVPHVTGTDRVGLLRRKSGALFHSALYTSAQIIGREKKGRRDDKVLFSALNIADVLECWQTITREAKVPVVGIYSVPMLTAMLVRKLKIRHPNTLFLSVQDGHLLRQSYFKKRKLKLSRLTRIKISNSENFLKNINNEVDRNKRYLERLQLVDFGFPMEVYVLTDGEQLQTLRSESRNDEMINYHVLNLNEISTRLGIKQTLSANESEWCFASLLKHKTPAGNYIQAKDQAYYSQFKLRKVFVAASLAFACLLTFWSGMDIHAGRDLALKTVQIERQTREISAELAKKDDSYLDSRYDPYVMRATVEVNNLLEKHKPDHLRVLAYIGSSLKKHPNIVLDKIKWGMLEGERVEAEYQQEHNAATPVESAIITGRLKKFPENYQAAFQQVDALLATLGSNKQVMAVRALSLPLDINPNSTLIGESRSQGEKNQARFELEIKLKGMQQDV